MASFTRMFIKIQAYRANLQFEQEYSLIMPFLDSLEVSRQRNIDIIAVLSEMNQIDDQVPVNNSVWYYADYIMPAVIIITLAVSGYIFFSYYFPPPSGDGDTTASAVVNGLSITSRGNESPVSVSVNDNTNTSNVLPDNWVATVGTLELDNAESPSETITQIILSTDFF